MTKKKYRNLTNEHTVSVFNIKVAIFKYQKFAGKYCDLRLCMSFEFASTTPLVIACSVSLSGTFSTNS